MTRKPDSHFKIRSQGLDIHQWQATGRFEIIDEQPLDIEQLAQWLHRVRLLTPAAEHECLPALYVYSAAGQWLSFYTEQDGLYCPDSACENLSVEEALHLIQQPQSLGIFEAKKPSLLILCTIVVLVLLSL